MYNLSVLGLATGELYLKGTHDQAIAPIDGAQMVANKAVWAIWSAAFYQTVEEYMTAGLFAGDDQAVATTTCARYPSLCSFKGNGWFGLQTYFGAKY